MKAFDRNTNVLKPITLDKSGTYDSRIKNKLVGMRASKNKDNKKNRSAAGEHFIREQSRGMAEAIKDNEALQETLPDIKLAKRIFVSGILSPNDMMSADLNYTLNDGVKNNEFTSSIIGIIEKHFSEVYKLSEILPRLIEDCLFDTGSYPLAIIPETTIDEVINSNCAVGVESLAEGAVSAKSPLGLLGSNNNTVGTESVSMAPDAWIGEHLQILDNFNFLKTPWIKDRSRNENISAILTGNSVGLEATHERTKNHYRRRRYDHVPLQTVKRPETTSEGEPIVMKLPSLATIPVHVPGDPSNHVGYFVLLDRNGHPLTYNDAGGVNKASANNAGDGGDDQAANLIRQTAMALGVERRDTTKNKLNLETYIGMIEDELKGRLEGGVFNDDVVLADVTAVAGIMFARALESKRSSLLFLPAELVTYFAFDYNKNGTGRSLLDKSRIVSGIRTVLMMSNVMGSVRNSVPRTGVSIELDPADIDPASTVEFLMAEFFKGQGDALPLWDNDPSSVTKSIQRSSVDVVVSGNSKYPQTRMGVEDKGRSVAKPDSDLENQMRRRHYMSMGLPPELIDAEMNVEFATAFISSNLMLAKEVSLYQKTLADQLEVFVRKYIRFNPALMSELAKVLEGVSNKDRDESLETLDDIIEALTITLPSPDTSKLDSQMRSYEVFTNALDNAFDSYFSEDMLGRMFGSDMEEAILPTITAMKAYFKRRWLRKNNVLPELEALVDVVNKDTMTDFNDVHSRHMDAFVESSGKLFRDIKKHGEKLMMIIEEDQADNEAERARLEQERYDRENAEEDDNTDDTDVTDEGGDEDESGVTDEGGGEATEETAAVPEGEETTDDGGIEIPELS